MLVQSLHKADSLGLEQRNQHIKFPRRCCLYIKAKLRSLCKHCTASVSPSNNPKWHEVCGIFFFFKQFNFRFGPFGFSGFRLDFRSGSGFGLKKCEGLVSTMFRQQAAKYPCEPSGRPWCVSFEVSKVLWTQVTLLGLAWTSNSQERTPSTWSTLFL